MPAPSRRASAISAAFRNAVIPIPAVAVVRSTAWIADSAGWAMQQFRPSFFYIYLPHLDYAAQKTGPDSPPAQTAVKELDDVIGKLAATAAAAYKGANLIWLVASEYVITPVSHVASRGFLYEPNSTTRSMWMIAATTMKLAPEAVWEFVKDMNNWAPFLTGYQKHEIENDTDSIWTLKGACSWAMQTAVSGGARRRMRPRQVTPTSRTP